MNDKRIPQRFSPQFEREIRLNGSMDLTLYKVHGHTDAEVQQLFDSIQRGTDIGWIELNFKSRPLVNAYSFLYHLSSNYNDQEVEFMDHDKVTEFVIGRLEEILSPLMIDDIYIVSVVPWSTKILSQWHLPAMEKSNPLDIVQQLVDRGQPIAVTTSDGNVTLKASDVKVGDQLLTSGLMTTGTPNKQEVFVATASEDGSKVQHNVKDPIDPTAGVTADTVKYKYEFGGGVKLSIHGTLNIIADDDATGVFEVTYGTTTVPNKIRIDNPNAVQLPLLEIYGAITSHVKLYMLPNAKLGVLYILTEEGLTPAVFPPNHGVDPKIEAQRLHEERIAWIEGVNVAMTMQELQTIHRHLPTGPAGTPAATLDFEDFKNERGAAFMQPHRVIYRGLYPAFAFVTHGGWAVVYSINGAVKISYNRSVEGAIPHMVDTLRTYITRDATQPTLENAVQDMVTNTASLPNKPVLATVGVSTFANNPNR